MKKIIIAAALLFAAITSVSGAEQARWIRQSSISPDGQTIAFSYQGDIFTVGVNGGIARQITSNTAYDANPLWTVDGKSIVFSSYREGSKDIFITTSEGGEPKRLTRYSGAETPLCTLADGTVLYSANIQADPAYGGFPGSAQVYVVDPVTAKSRLVTSITTGAMSVNASGIAIYEDNKGCEDPLRKHHTSSVTRDIWMHKDGVFTKLSSFCGEDREPVFAADGNSFWYLSEEGGSFNVWKSSISNPSVKSQVSRMEKHPVRGLSASKDGKLCFSWNGDLYTMTEGGQPQKVEVNVLKDRMVREKTYTRVGSGARQISVSPNGKEIALVADGEVFVTAVEYKQTQRITNTAEQERGVSFAPDGRTLYYASERDGEWGIWKSELVNKEDKFFCLAYDFKEERFSPVGQTCYQPAVSPDGKWVAYLKDRTDVVIRSTSGNKEKMLLQGTNYSYSDGDQHFAWSPDSRYILSNYGAEGRWNNQDIALIDIESGVVTDLTLSGYSDYGFRWALKGHAMTWLTDKDGYRSHGSWGAQDDIYAMFFDGKTLTSFAKSKDAEDLDKMVQDESKKKKDEKKDTTASKEKKAEKLSLELDALESRTMRLTRGSGMIGDHFLTEDGTKLYYTLRLEKGMDLCRLDLKDKSIKVVQKGVSGRFYPSADGKYIYVTGMGISRIDVATGTSKSISFSSPEYEQDAAAQRAYIFSHVWKQVDEKFYDSAIHGIDWPSFRSNYEQFLPYIKNNYDFKDLLSEMLGELNASHTGARYRPVSLTATGHIGVLWDESYSGDGLRIKEVLPGGPLNLADSEVKEGDIVLAVDGKKIEAGTAWYEALDRKVGKEFVFSVKKGGKSENLRIKPSTNDSELLYKRWVRQREDMVAKLSGGKIGYVHVKAMNSESFREVYSKALGEYRSCDALIVDTRHNGGGWLHDDLATFLGGKAYVEFRPRGQYIGTEPYNKWTKPSCVLMGEDNYSDACGFPYAYRALGIGKLIGAPVPGTMTAVWWENQVDPTLVFGIPQVTNFGLKEQKPLENNQIEPDILVYNDPASELRGEDLQLEAAVKEMLAQTSNK